MDAIVTQRLIVNWRKKTVKKLQLKQKGGQKSELKTFHGRCIAAIFRIVR
jgi:hypothetical protein